MKAITLHQPWASLIAVGAKRIETRSWSTRYRGPLAIHAGMRHPPTGLTEGAVCGGLVSRSTLRYHDRVDDRFHWSSFANATCLIPLPLGAVVAVANLVDVLPMQAFAGPNECLVIHDDGGVEQWIPGEEYPGMIRSLDDQAPFGDFAPGRWAWMLEDVRPCAPIPMRGHQGLWTWA